MRQIFHHILSQSCIHVIIFIDRLANSVKKRWHEMRTKWWITCYLWRIRNDLLTEQDATFSFVSAHYDYYDQNFLFSLDKTSVMFLIALHGVFVVRVSDCRLSDVLLRVFLTRTGTWSRRGDFAVHGEIKATSRSSKTTCRLQLLLIPRGKLNRQEEIAYS